MASKAKETKKTRKVNPYSDDLLKRIISVLVALVISFTERLKKGEKLEISVSHGNTKIGHTMNVSLAPVICCGNCKECKRFCYDIKACVQYENVRLARAKNTAIFNYDREMFFNQLWAKMSRKKSNKYLRFHVSGEIKDYNHLEWIVETARRFPDFKIWTYTKMYGLVNLYIMNNGGKKETAIPGNLTIMFSEWQGMPMENPYKMPVFRCINKGEKLPGCMKCPGNCNVCKASGKGCINGYSVFTYLH